MSEWSFEGLSDQQVDVLANVAFGGAGGGVPRRAMRPLVERGFVDPVERVEQSGGMVFRWTEYVMPLPVHIAFCEWCAERFPDAEAGAG